MIGLIGKKAKTSEPFITVVPGRNARAVNLKPWDIELIVNKSKLYPDGRRIIPAASQDDFKTIAEAVTNNDYIGELDPEQERIVKDSLSKNCAWYKAKLTEAKAEADKKASPFKTSEKP